LFALFAPVVKYVLLGEVTDGNEKFGQSLNNYILNTFKLINARLIDNMEHLLL